MIRRSMLFNGDAVATTGFANATHHVCDVLRRSWDLTVLGINFWGSHHNFPYHIEPANPGGNGDFHGLWRVPDLLKQLRPDALVVHNDPWNVQHYVKQFASLLPVIAWMPVDAKNVKEAKNLNGLAMAITYTQFAIDELRKGGYAGPACVVGLGVDTDIFRPVDMHEARRRTLPPEIREGFIVGNVNRNQPRKRMDLSVSYFAEWIKEYDIRDAYLYLHLAPTGDKGWDVKQLAKYYGIQNRLITPKNIPLGIGVPIEHLAMVMNSFDIGINTGWGEGFGLTTLEMMACAKPVIVGDWSAHAEWATTAIRVPCTSTMTMWNDVNTIGGIPDRTAFIKAMNEMYVNGPLRRKIGADSFALSRQPQFQWADVGMAFSEAVDAAMVGAEIEPLEAMLPEREPIS